MVTDYPAPVRVKTGATVISKFWSIAILGLTLCPAAADSKIETAGTAIAIGMPLLASGITAYKHDWTGSAQLVVTTVLTVGTAYGLKQIVKECRPFAKPCTPMAAIGIHSRPIPAHWLQLRQVFFGAGMAGNTAYRPLPPPRSSAIRGWTQRSITGGIRRRAPASR